MQQYLWSVEYFNKDVFSPDLLFTVHYYMTFENLFNKFPRDISKENRGFDENLAKLPEVVGH